MKEVFEKILERLEESATCEDSGWCNYCQYNWCPLELVEREEVEKIVKKVAEQYNNGWIPCSERLPDITKTYLVTIKSKSKGDFYSTYALFGKNGFVAQDYQEVVAWQPLPEPYQQKGE